MSTLRQDPTTRQWVIVAPVRADRPHQPAPMQRPELAEHDPLCPFCPGNEDQTPPEISRYPTDGDWEVRVFPNLYGALSGDGSVARTGPPLFRQMPGVGSHEVVVESRRHNARIDTMTTEEVAHVIQMWRVRYRELIDQPHIRAVVVFKNFGMLAGTSLVHPHSQIVATPVFLPGLLRRVDVATHYYDENGSCVYDDIVAAEREDGRRIVDECGNFIAFEPWGAATPYETWVAPTFHQSSFGDLGDEEIDELATILIRTLAAIRRACADPDFNLVLFSAPSNGQMDRVFHWHIKLLPRLTTTAGFELGSAMSINIVPAEDAAEALRKALVAANAVPC
jgi:UDPglucose--hexose-1-phosphate uridylyltransferase